MHINRIESHLDKALERIDKIVDAESVDQETLTDSEYTTLYNVSNQLLDVWVRIKKDQRLIDRKRPE